MIRRPPRSTPFPTRRSSDLDTLRRTSLSGTAGDPRIRRVLVDTVRDSRNAGLRLEALDVPAVARSEEHTSELQSLRHLVCRLLLDKKKATNVTRLNHAITTK